ncbi:addiction module antitoxin [Bifidobacterium lemurum]|uniref:Addiction module antitoxin n=2 Tax=Bifidobacterium lemurum TaxID=1603886 RepID=A0A261FV30_9BIFI|nr:addiction module antidote protein [Bifidobacterium lemurum]OZG63047.1 addiction module antitoxin [Bifidobacterium lemurum]QOL35426.1 putative addiction module antidote protein [Bifidobacterium lemurum]
MTDTAFSTWHIKDDIRSDEDAIGYLNAALEERDSASLQDMLDVVARARGMTGVARTSGLGREPLYKALRPDSKPSFDTIMRVADALGAQLYSFPQKHQHGSGA